MVWLLSSVITIIIIITITVINSPDTWFLTPLFCVTGLHGKGGWELERIKKIYNYDSDDDDDDDEDDNNNKNNVDDDYSSSQI